MQMSPSVDTRIQSDRDAFLSNDLAKTMLETIPDPAMVLNHQCRIIAVNARMLASVGANSPDDVLGQRMGDLVQCVNAHDGPDGCGSGPACQLCGGAQVVGAALESDAPAGGEGRIRTYREIDGGALELDVVASPVTTADAELVVVAMHDKSAEKRRAVLERVFFHDVLNIASGIQAVAQILAHGEGDPGGDEECKRDLWRMSEQLAEEISVQRQLLAAERGELQPALSLVNVREMLESVAELYRHHTVARDRELRVGAAPEYQLGISTDATLLRRVLGNLVKNALEASRPGEVVAIEAEDIGGQTVFRVTNPEIGRASCRERV